MLRYGHIKLKYAPYVLLWNRNTTSETYFANPKHEFIMAPNEIRSY